MGTMIFEAVFEKYSGETKIILARNFEDAHRKALDFSRIKKFGPLGSLELYGEADIE